MSDLDTALSNISSLSLYFKYHILADIITATLIPWKGSFSNITCRDVSILYYLVKKCKINCAIWFHEYMLGREEDAQTSSILPYGRLITQIFQLYSIDLSSYPTVEISATYDSKTFTSMVYVSVDEEWCRKDSAKEKLDLPKVSKPISNPMFQVLSKLEELKVKTIKDGVVLLQESTSKLF